MVGRLIPDDIHYRRMGPARIVKIGDPVGKAWSAVEQRHRWFLRHPCITISTARDDGFGHTEHATHSLHPIKGDHQLYFGSARIGKANLDTRGD
jgi:hypothetical protein